MSNGATVIAFIAGCCIGAVLGWFTNEIRRARKTVAQAVDVMGKLDVTVTRSPDDPEPVAKLKRRWWQRGEGGTTTEGVVLFVVVVITAGSAFYAAGASNNANQAADAAALAAAQVARVTACNHRVLTSTLIALNQRSVYTDSQFKRNRDLENAQARLVAASLSGNRTGNELQDYFDALTAKRIADVKAFDKRDQFPFPDPNSITKCN